MTPSVRAAGTRFAAVLLAGMAALPAAGARAQSVSPGPLSEPHSALEGVAHCTRCHEMGERRIAASRCFACHAPLGERVRAGLGWHASPEVRGAECETCHHEHAGRDVPLVNWKGGRAAFDHGKTGYALEGGHRRADCGDCHDPRRVRDAGVRERLAANPRARTFLGLTTACADCHFDEHRGQLGADCGDCHDSERWKPAPGFAHERAGYPLRGAHRGVECARCHRSEADPAGEEPGGAFPPPRSPRFARYRPVPAGECSDCHSDPHAGRLGALCTSCHDPAGWRAGTAPGAGRFDHSRTRYPLEGRHRDAACETCHRLRADGTRALTGLRFARCDDCHEDAHGGQVAAIAARAPGRAAGETGEAGCERCHTVQGFAPARFTLADHAATRYPLEEAHAAVPCRGCHADDPELRGRAKEPMRLDYGNRSLGDCGTCHADPHQGQFAAEGGGAAGRPARACADCHGMRSFRTPRFDHGRDARFPLRGRHAELACGACHRRRSAALGGTPVAYRGLPLSCAGCHADPHLGQFARAGRADCAACHDETAFRPAPGFDHARARLALTGAHAAARCEACHREVDVPGVGRARHYRPLAVECAGCHADPHQGAFAPGAESRDCESCHQTGDWKRVRFDHERTRFPLFPQHRHVECRACHPEGRRALPAAACAGCHDDPHAGRLGSRCDGCHRGAEGFREVSGSEFHDRTQLPLAGAHELVPCASCHVDRVRGDPLRPDARCKGCHEEDYLRAGTAGGMDHLAWGFGPDCRTCHDTERWDSATFREHERCFPLRSGHHAGITCLACHTSLAPGAPGTCRTLTAACTRCHPCAAVGGRHAGVPGYECADRKCYECHPDGGGGE